MSEKRDSEDTGCEDRVHAIATGQRARTVEQSRGIGESDRGRIQCRVSTVDIRSNSRTRGRRVVALNRYGFEKSVEVAWPIVSLGDET